jgi:hypothetical protein
VDASEIDAWYNILSEKLMGVSRRFVFNVDETGCSEHIERENSHGKSPSPSGEQYASRIPEYMSE